MSKSSSIPMGNYGKLIDCFCPQCRKTHKYNMELKYVNDKELWRIDGKIVVMCSECKGNKIRR